MHTCLSGCLVCCLGHIWAVFLSSMLLLPGCSSAGTVVAGRTPDQVAALLSAKVASMTIVLRPRPSQAVPVESPAAPSVPDNSATPITPTDARDPDAVDMLAALPVHATPPHGMRTGRLDTAGATSLHAKVAAAQADARKKEREKHEAELAAQAVAKKASDDLAAAERAAADERARLEAEKAAAIDAARVAAAQAAAEKAAAEDAAQRATDAAAAERLARLAAEQAAREENATVRCCSTGCRCLVCGALLYRCRAWCVRRSVVGLSGGAACLAPCAALRAVEKGVDAHRCQVLFRGRSCLVARRLVWLMARWGGGVLQLGAKLAAAEAAAARAAEAMAAEKEARERSEQAVAEERRRVLLEAEAIKKAAADEIARLAYAHAKVAGTEGV